MTEIETKCIEWGKARGLFDGSNANQQTAQMGKLWEEYTEWCGTGLGSMEEEDEEGDVLFVLNNLLYILGISWEDFIVVAKTSPHIKIPLVGKIRLTNTASHSLQLRFMCNCYRPIGRKDIRQETLAKTLAKITARTGKTVGNNFVKD